MPLKGTNFDEKGLTAIVTGGGSGFAKEFSRILHEAGANVIIADMNESTGNSFVNELNKDGQNRASFVKVNVVNWEEQKQAFEFALEKYGRIDYVLNTLVSAPIAGVTENRYLPKENEGPFVKPDLRVMDINLTGVLYTCSLAIQAFRRQDVNRHGFRGKIICLGSTTSFYAIPTAPIYSSSKHGVAAYVRASGQLHFDEKITVNGVCPHVVRTNISTEAFYSKLEAKNLLTEMDSVQEALTTFLGTNSDTGQLLEVVPGGKIVPYKEKPFINKETELAFDIVHQRGLPLMK